MHVCKCNCMYVCMYVCVLNFSILIYQYIIRPPKLKFLTPSLIYICMCVNVNVIVCMYVCMYVS